MKAPLCPWCYHREREQALELGDVLGHDNLGHRLVNQLASTGILTMQRFHATAWATIAREPRLGPKALQRLHDAHQEQP